MKRPEFKTYKHRFKVYAHQFWRDDDEFDAALKFKLDHTFRVCANIVRLGRAIPIPSKMHFLAKLSALMHDVGRFKQYALYGTFIDMLSINHAKLGIHEIASHRLLNDLSLADRRLVLKAIAVHNTYRLPDMDDGPGTVLNRLLRDADKLDILNVVLNKLYPTTYGSILSALKNVPIVSDAIARSIYQKRPARIKDVTTVLDIRLFYLSWVFDLNFKTTYHLIDQKSYFDRMVQGIPKSDDTQRILDLTQAHFQRKLNQ